MTTVSPIGWVYAFCLSNLEHYIWPMEKKFISIPFITDVCVVQIYHS